MESCAGSSIHPMQCHVEMRQELHNVIWSSNRMFILRSSGEVIQDIANIYLMINS